MLAYDWNHSQSILVALISTCTRCVRSSFLQSNAPHVAAIRLTAF
jgi:hypothetical protein